MAVNLPSQQDLYDLYKNEVQSRTPELTDFEIGAINDAIAGAFSVGGQELVKLVVDLFSKTYINTAHGPEVTGDADDLQLLAVDHFGDSFARPPATKSLGTVSFTRPNADAGDVLITAGTIVATDKNANAESQRFSVVADVLMTATAINASVEAEAAGADGNANPGTVTNIETALTDGSVVVTNSAAMAGGGAEASDTEYREFIRLKVEEIRGATKAAIEAAAQNVAGVEIATAIEDLVPVKEWDIGGGVTVGDYFTIPRVRLFVADANGTASDPLIANVAVAVDAVRACGVRVQIFAATSLPMDWLATISLNPAGPNFAELSTDTSSIEETMTQYINDLAIGSDFDRSIARSAILNVWGPGGTNDLTDFTTDQPTGNIISTVTQKLVPQTIGAS